MEGQDYPIYAVVMDLVKGKRMKYLNRENRLMYRDPTTNLILALLEHGIVKHDLKRDELICTKDNVIMVDTHLIQWKQPQIEMPTAYQYILQSVGQSFLP